MIVCVSQFTTVSHFRLVLSQATLTYPNSDSKRQKIHSDMVVAREDQNRKVDQGDEGDKEEKDHPKPKKHKYLLNDIVCGQQTEIISG